MIIEALLIALPFMVGLAVSGRRRREIFAALVAMKVVLVLVGISLLHQPLVASGIVTVCLSVTSFVGGLLFGSRKPAAQFGGLAGISLICGALLTATVAGELTPRVRKEAVQTARWVDSPPEAAWNSLKGFVSPAGERPLLMRLGGLPTPLRCELDEEALGAKRTCHFEQGRIEQLVTSWEPPRHLALKIIGTDLPVQLFEFTTASYALTPKGAQTHVLRTTDFESRLVPTWFWRPLERLMVDEEHRFLLAELHGRFVKVGPEPGVAVRVSVKTNPPTTVTVIPAMGSDRPPVELGRTPIDAQHGAYVGDTILLVNEARGVRYEEVIEYGQPNELKLISKVFK
jgi:hypothetical protein